MTASTSFNDLHLPYHGRLGVIAPNSLGGWCPYKDDKDEYLQVDLGKRKRVSGNRKSKLTFFYRFLVDGTSGKKIDFLANAFREKINKFIISNQ